MTLPRWAHYAAAAVLLSAGYFSGLSDIRMHNNESAWIGTSYYFEAFLGENVNAARPDLPADVWAEGFWTLTQPPLALYAIGLGRRLGGFTIRDLNEPWIHGGKNAREVPAQTPSAGLLTWSRRPMAFLSMITGLFCFFIVARCAGLVAAYAFVVLFVTNPFFLVALRRAMGDPVVTVFGVAAIAAAISGLHALARARAAGSGASRATRASPALWAIAAGACCGLSGAAKLNGLSGAFGVAALAGIAAVLAPRALAATENSPRAPAAVARRVRWRAAPIAAALVLVTAAIAFVAPSPYLRRGPIHGLRKMLKHRVESAQRQRLLNPAYPVDGVIDGVRTTAYRVLVEHRPLRFWGGSILGAALLCVGAAALLRDALRGVMAHAPNAALAVVVVGASQAIPSVFSPLDWDRYYLFPVLFGSVCVAIGVAIAARRCARLISARSAPHTVC